jgi:hypothetical protein
MFKKLSIYFYKRYKEDAEEFIAATFALLVSIAMIVALIGIGIVAFKNDPFTTIIVVGIILACFLIPTVLVSAGKHYFAQEDQ